MTHFFITTAHTPLVRYWMICELMNANGGPNSAQIFEGPPNHPTTVEGSSNGFPAYDDGVNCSRVDAIGKSPDLRAVAALDVYFATLKN